jgi:molecular chaperone DnaJ
MKDYYEILDLPEDAADEAIKQQFRKLANLYHPDKNNFSEKESLNKFIDINEAYKVLSDTNKRKQYNEKLHELRLISEEKITAYRSRVRNGGDINLELSLSQEEIMSDEEQEVSPEEQVIYKKVEYERFIKCSNCNGLGKEPGTKIIPCDNCGGSGLVINRQTNAKDICQNCDGYGDIILYKCKKCKGNSRVKELFEGSLSFNKIDLKDGNKIKFESMGDSGAFGGTHGDLIVTVNIAKTENKKFKKNNQSADKNINAADAFDAEDVRLAGEDNNNEKQKEKNKGIKNLLSNFFNNNKNKK